MVRLLVIYDKPFLCSGIYTVSVCLLGLAFVGPVPKVFLSAALAFVLSSIYFWLLDYFSEGIFWWLILPCGILVSLP